METETAGPGIREDAPVEASGDATMTGMATGTGMKISVARDELVAKLGVVSRALTDSSLPKIGKEFGGRDHTTVMHANAKIEGMIREDRSVYNLVQELTARNKQAG